VLDARATEKSRELDVSLFDRSLQNLSYLATWYLSDGHVQGREPRSGHPSLIGSQLYRRRDGFIFIMCNKEKFWPTFPHLQGPARQPRAAQQTARRGAVGAQRGQVARPFRRPCPRGARQRHPRGARQPLRAPAHRIRDYKRSGAPPLRMVAGPVVTAGDPPTRAAPALGADTDAVRRDCGFSDADLRGLRAERVI
jgi:succinate--hydroxymethylglutarate CoA-transferase